jgi:DNA-binding response OmpR family regulator
MAVKRIIIVDDTMSVGRLVESTLTTLGGDLSISVVPSAEEALLESGLYQVELIITDYRLPGISGIELANRMRKRSPQTKVIVMSGVDDSTIENQAIEAGAVAFFAKPLDLEQFMATTRAVLGLAADEQAKTQGASEVKVAEAPSEPAASLPDILGDLRSQLGAHSVLLLGEDGRIVAQAGDLPHIDFESVWVSPLMTLISSSHRASHLVGGASAAMVMTLRGEENDLLLAPVGVFGLVITLETGGGRTGRAAAAIDETMIAQKELADLLENMGIRLHTGEAAPAPDAATFSETETPNPDEDANRITTSELEALFESKSKVSQDADAFWDELSTSSGAAVTNPDALSFDEAQKLGLAPDDFNE